MDGRRRPLNAPCGEKQHEEPPKLTLLVQSDATTDWRDWNTNTDTQSKATDYRLKSNLITY